MGSAMRVPYYFLVPALSVYLLFFIVPMANGLVYSFTNWHIDVKNIDFIGLDNFKRMFGERELLKALKNTFIFAALVTLLQNGIGLALALLLNVRLLFRTLLRTAFYLPVVISPLIVGYIFTALYIPDEGLVNRFLRSVGLSALQQDWLNEPSTALYAVIATDVWRVAGFAMVIYLAGLQTIPKEMLEASAIDGASYAKKLRYVIFPLLAPAFTVNFLLSLIGSLKVFEIVFVLTRGGPGYETEVFNTYILRSFSHGTYGYASAVNLALIVIISVIGYSVLYFLRRREVEV